MTEAVAALRLQYDPQWGGFGRAPKFPPASTIEFLLRRGAFDLALGTLDGMRAGGMYDVVGGGFHRYSVDGQWLVPHFEKMLYDNALLVPAYLHAWVLTQEPGIAGSPSRRSTTSSASCASTAAASRLPRTPTPTASRG